MRNPPLTLRQRDPAILPARRAAIMAAAGGRPVVVFGMGSALGGGTRSHGGMRFLTGWDSHESASLLVMTRAGCHLLLTSPFMEPAARETVPELAPRYLPQPLWPQHLRDLLAGQAPVLIGGAEMPMGLYQPLAPILAGGEDFTPVLDAARQIKAPAAIALHQAGAEICDHLFAALPEAIKIGRTGRESQRILEDTALRLGAEYCRTWLTLRPQADHPRYWPEETGRAAALGDQMLFGVALTVDGHWAHGLRMGHIGAVPDTIAQMHAHVQTALDAGLAALRPDQPVSDAVRAMAAATDLAAAAFGFAELRQFRTGHGLGLTYEEPGLTAAFPQRFGAYPETMPKEDGPLLREGMILELHPNLFVPGHGGAALGQMICITNDGARLMLTAPTEVIAL
jgi:Xaa-Pro aminopeptidase